MSDFSDYSANCDDDSCYSDDVHSVDSYDTPPSFHHPYNGAPSENCCPCQPVQIQIFHPKNVYIPTNSYDGVLDETNCL